MSVCLRVCVHRRRDVARWCGYSIRPRQCVRKLPGNTWAWCRDKCTLAFAYFSPSRSPYPPSAARRRSVLRSRFYPPLSTFSLLPSLLSFHRPSFTPFFSLDHVSCRAYNRGFEYRTDIYGDRKWERWQHPRTNAMFRVPVVIFTMFHEGNHLSRRTGQIYFGKAFPREILIFRERRSYIRRIGVNKNRSYESERWVWGFLRMTISIIIRGNHNGMFRVIEIVQRTIEATVRSL